MVEYEKEQSMLHFDGLFLQQTPDSVYGRDKYRK